MDLGALAVEGTLQWSDPLRATAYLVRVEGKRLRVSIESIEPGRTLPQLRMIWGTYKRGLRAMSAHSGHTTKELHEWMKQEFLIPEMKFAPDGSVLGLTYTTKTLTVEETSEYITRVLTKFADWGVEL